MKSMSGIEEQVSVAPTMPTTMASHDSYKKQPAEKIAIFITDFWIT